MHITMRVVSPDADPFILPIIMVLNGLGIAMIYRIGLADQLEGWDNAGVRQIAWTAVAIVIAIATLLIIRNHRVLQRYRYVAMFSGILLLLLPMLPVIGSVQNGARLWIQLGAFSFQPGELGKVALAIFFAGYLVTAGTRSRWSAARCSGCGCREPATSAPCSWCSRPRCSCWSSSATSVPPSCTSGSSS